MKHPTKREEKRIMDITDDFDCLFSVMNFDRSFTYKKEESDSGCVAEIEVDIPYQRVHINIYPTFWEHSLKEQREFLLHEFCHTLVTPIHHSAIDLFDGVFLTKKQIINAVEETTSRIAQLMDAQLRGKNKYARVAYEKYLKK